MTINVKATGENIDRMRIERGMTVAELRQEIGVGTDQSIYKWLRGVGMPSLDNLVILAALFDVKIDDIVVIE